MSNVDRILHTLGEMYPDAACELTYTNPFQLLVAVVLSAQTTDIAVNKVTPKLFSTFPNVHALSIAKAGEVESIIQSIGLYKTKSRNLVALSKQLMNRYQGNVPNSLEALMDLPGVGRKTANVVLSEAFHVPRIAVDTHVFRVSTRLGLAKGADVYKVEQQLMSIISEELWSIAHQRLLFFGRYLCKSQKPDCTQCPFVDICNYPNKNL